MACIWITIGCKQWRTPEGPNEGWVDTFVNAHMDDYNELKGNRYDREGDYEELYEGTFHHYCYEIFVNAAYFILTTITTVGYGDISGSTTEEYGFSMCVEFIGLTFFSLLTGTINVMFSGN